MERDLNAPPENVVHCCACHLLVTVPSTVGIGDVLTCPFCTTKIRLRAMTVFVSEPVVEA